MCGIAGILRVHQPGAAPPPPHVAIPETWLDLLDESIKHRGPDGAGRFRDRAVRPDGSVVDVALVHRRLSIIDHAGGAQPMVLGGPPLRGGGAGLQPANPVADAPGSFGGARLRPCPRCAALGKTTIAVVFNGCIYNHRELRRELQAAGHEFTTDHSDTEVLVHGWGEWGPQVYTRLDGMFAIVTWDARHGTIALSRDAFGEKPLYSTTTARHADPVRITAFASTVPPLLRLRYSIGGPHDATTGIDARPWIKFGWNQVTPFETVCEEFWGSQQVIPRVGSADDVLVHQHSADVMHPQHRRITAGEIDAALAASVAERLEADVLLSCFLSGGIDSALVCHYARRARPDIRALTVRMPHPDYDESENAAATARVLGVQHDILDCDPHPAEDLSTLIPQLGLPFGDSSLLPSLWVSRAARQHAAVALGGDGGDDLFCGYERIRAVRLIARLAAASSLGDLASIVPRSSEPKSRRSRLGRLLRAASGAGYKELVAIFEPPYDRRIGAVGGQIHYGMTQVGGDYQLAMELARRFDIMFYLPGDLMRKSDTASMSVALEVRSPFLARSVAELGIHGSIESLMPGGQRKGLLREVARKYFPAEIVDRPKQGFAIPIGEWFRSDYGGLRQLLLDHLNGPEPFGPDRLGVGPMINMAFVKQMLREHDDAGKKSLWPWKGRDHSQRLYMLLVLSIWAKWLARI